MALNLSALLAAAKQVATHPLTKGTGLATLISGGLYAASIAGVVIPGWAFTVGPILGIIAYKLSPPKIQAEIDDVTTKVTDIANDIPNLTVEHTYPPDSATGLTLGNLDKE